MEQLTHEADVLIANIDDVLDSNEEFRTSLGYSEIEQDVGRFAMHFPESSEEIHEPIFGSARRYVDALGTSEEAEAWKSLKNDARTQIFEILTAYGHLHRPIKSQWNEQKDGFVSYGLGLREMYERALHVPNIPQHELKRRQAELHEEILIEQLYKTGMFEGRALLTISPYPYQLDDKTAERQGYRPKNHKYMLRWNVVDEDGSREQTSLSMSGSDLNVLNRLYVKLGYASEDELGDVDMISHPILFELSEISSVVEVARMIDEMNGGQAFGEDSDVPADYDNVAKRSWQREQRADQEVELFALKWAQIEASDYHYDVKIKMWQLAIKETIGLIVMEQTEFASVVGDQTMSQLRLAKVYMDQGNVQMASQAFSQGLNSMKKLGGSCGGLGDYERDDLFSMEAIIDMMTDPYGMSRKKGDSETDQSNEEIKFKTTCKECGKKVTATMKDCIIKCSNGECKAAKGVSA